MLNLRLPYKLGGLPQGSAGHTSAAILSLLLLFNVSTTSVGAFFLSPSKVGGSITGGAGFTDRTKLGTLSVPSVGIGTIAWTPKSEEDDRRIASVAAAAKAAGLDFFDTAERYGASGLSLVPAALANLGVPVNPETLGGDCESNLARWGAGCTVATKFTPTPWRRSAQSVVDACAQSARRLGVDQISLYQIHMPDIIQPFARIGFSKRKDEIYWDGLAECYHRGLVQNVGVSNYGPALVERAQEALAKRGVPLASNQINLNLLYRDQGSLATVERCEELGVKVLAYYPLAMGLLTGKLTPSMLRGKKDPRSRDLLCYLEGGNGCSAGKIPRGGIQPFLAVLHEVASRAGKTPAQVALNWVICKGAIPLPGASSPAQVEENAGALGWRLADEDVAKLEEAADRLSFEFNGAGFQTSASKFVGYGFERWRLD